MLSRPVSVKIKAHSAGKIGEAKTITEYVNYNRAFIVTKTMYAN